MLPSLHEPAMQDMQDGCATKWRALLFVVGGGLLAVFPRPETSGTSSPVAKRTSDKEPSTADRRNKVAQTAS